MTVPVQRLLEFARKLYNTSTEVRQITLNDLIEILRPGLEILVLNMDVSKEECNFECERSLRRIINSVKVLFREHYDFFHKVAEEQKVIIDDMWVLSQRFLILTRGALCVRPYPREPTDREERETKAMFKEKKDLLHETNCKLTASVYALKEKCGAFDRALRKVDPSLPSPIVEGGPTRKPIYFYIELFADIFRFFSASQNKLNMLGKFLMVDDITSILEYKELLEPENIVNKYFEECLETDVIPDK